MPTYVYECSSCKSQFEAEQRITENPLTSCACGSEGTVKRIIQPIAVMFKGSGFHINDYAGKSPAPTTSEPVTAPAEAPAAPAATPASTPDVS
ncbi:MAG: FmdB family zinc ribbon protein [Fimbriimonas sp.]